MPMLVLQEQTSVHVQITDVNDNPPDFKNTPYSVTLSEVNSLRCDLLCVGHHPYLELQNTNTGRTVLTVVATDADIGANSRIQYKISDGDTVGIRVSVRGHVNHGLDSIQHTHCAQ